MLYWDVLIFELGPQRRHTTLRCVPGGQGQAVYTARPIKHRTRYFMTDVSVQIRVSDRAKEML
jgi:hypothetical protein